MGRVKCIKNGRKEQKTNFDNSISFLVTSWQKVIIGSFWFDSFYVKLETIPFFSKKSPFPSTWGKVRFDQKSLHFVSDSCVKTNISLSAGVSRTCFPSFRFNNSPVPNSTCRWSMRPWIHGRDGACPPEGVCPVGGGFPDGSPTDNPSVCDLVQLVQRLRGGISHFWGGPDWKKREADDLMEKNVGRGGRRREERGKGTADTPQNTPGATRREAGAGREERRKTPRGQLEKLVFQFLDTETGHRERQIWVLHSWANTLPWENHRISKEERRGEKERVQDSGAPTPGKSRQLGGSSFERVNSSDLRAAVILRVRAQGLKEKCSKGRLFLHP